MWLLLIVIVWAGLGVMAYLLKKGLGIWGVLAWLIFSFSVFGGWVWMEKGRKSALGYFLLILCICFIIYFIHKDLIRTNIWKWIVRMGQ